MRNGDLYFVTGRHTHVDTAVIVQNPMSQINILPRYHKNRIKKNTTPRHDNNWHADREKDKRKESCDMQEQARTHTHTHKTHIHTHTYNVT